MNDFNLCNNYNCEYFNCCHFWDDEIKTFCRKGIELCEISKKEKDKEKMIKYEITTELHLKNIIAESKEVAEALNEFADKLEQIEEKYAYKEKEDE